MSGEFGARAREILARVVVWDAHAGFPFERAGDLEELGRWRAAGIDYVSVNIGYDYQPWTTALEAASAYRHWMRAHRALVVPAIGVGDIARARSEGKIAIGFDIEGANALNGDAGMVDVFYKLGVRQMLFAYNRNNLAGGGCHDADTGLTGFGREVLAEMNRVGMVVDASHCGARTARELMERSATPVIFSHSNARAVWDHERNVSDELIRQCAAGGGVVGITGVGPFLGRRGAVAEHVVEHIDHVVGLVGAGHVGLGIDSVLEKHGALDDMIGGAGARERFYWPEAQYATGAGIGILPPEALPAIVEGLLARGYDDAAIAGIVGGNFLRLATAVWKPVVVD